MTRYSIILAALLVAAPAWSATESYTVDPVHSFPNFSVGHLGMSTIYGRFDRMSGTIALDRTAKTGSLVVKIESASVTTGDAKHEPGSAAAKAFGPRSRDEHLRSGDFFNAVEFPEITYKSSQFNFKGDVLESIDGTLTMLGVAKPVKLTVTAFKCAPNPFTKKAMCGADAAATVKRSEFGMKTFIPAVSDEVKLMLGVEAYSE